MVSLSPDYFHTFLFKKVYLIWREKDQYYADKSEVDVHGRAHSVSLISEYI